MINTSSPPPGATTATTTTTASGRSRLDHYLPGHSKYTTTTATSSSSLLDRHDPHDDHHSHHHHRGPYSSSLLNHDRPWDIDLDLPLTTGGGGRTSTDYKYEFLTGDNNYNSSSSKTSRFNTTTDNHLFTTTTTAAAAGSHSPESSFLQLNYNSRDKTHPTATTSALAPLTKATSSTLDNLGLRGLGGSGVGESSYLKRTMNSSSSNNNHHHNISSTSNNNNNNTNTTTKITSSKLQMLDDVTRQIEDTIDSIEIPARGRCKVFMAKYGYDPFKQSPNENPDAELALNAGDYIMVFDDIDEDGYFIGELMDGRRGYVPSNWLDRLTGEDLFEFQANVLYKQAGGGGGGGANGGLMGDQQRVFSSSIGAGGLLLDGMDPTCGVGGGNLDSLAGYPPEFYDAIIADTMNHSNFQHLLAPEDYHRMNDYVDLNDVDEVDDECLSDYERAEAEQMRRAVPPPQRLLLERQLNKCILIAWLHPQAAKGTIVSYQVYVDGVLKSTVPSGDRTKALLEGVDSNIPHRISVRALDLHGRHSNDAGCTIVVGQKIPFAPSCVKASHITSHSALISWLPCNSNFHHVVAVNSVEVSTTRPGVYKHLAQGLSANTLYRVWVRAKPGKILPIDEKNPKKLESLTTYVDFKTMPKSLPDPPVNVQVEAGPQRRTLLVTWLPLTLNDYGGSSNGCAVTGYAVFAGHKKLADIDSPTGDHALLDIGDLESLHKKSVTVRTKSGENLSQDSMPCHIPDEYLKAGSSGNSKQQHLSSSSGHHQHHGRAQVVAAAGGSSSSPSRQRLAAAAAAQQSYSQQRANMARGYGLAGQSTGAHRAALHQQRTGRPLTRSLQNLESDLESRRSSIPAIEITREISGSDTMMPGGGGGSHQAANQTTESFSEEEFENSMRLRGTHRGGVGGGHLSKMSGRAPGQAGRFRSRQSHSVEDHHHHPSHHSHLSHNRDAQMSRPFHSQASLAAGRGGRGATPLGTSGPNEVHYFVALFDYDPLTMSPNPNAAAEELAFKEGSIIKIYGGPGEDGFFKGELVEGPSAGALGYVPSNVITEITDPGLLASLYERNGGGGGGPMQSAQQQQQQPSMSGVGLPAGIPAGTNAAGQFNTNANLASSRQNPLLNQQQAILNDSMSQQQQQQPASQTTGGAVKRMVALYDYDPQENSPNADTESEIPFKTGDVIYVYGKMDTDGFYMGEVERTKQRGLVPSNFLREEPLVGGQKTIQQQQQQPGGGLMAGNNQQSMQQFNQQVSGQPQQQPMGMAANQFNQQTNPQQQQQQQQQQQLRNQQQHQQNMIRGQLVGGTQQQMSQQPQQQNINRPNSLSLGAQNNPAQQGAMMMNANPQQQQQMAMQQMQQNGTNMLNNQQALLLQQQQQQQQQQMQGANKNAFNPQTGAMNQFVGVSGVGGNPMVVNQQAQQQQRNQQMNLQQQLNQQQQQQNQGGGVLGNLLTSGKQIIGAATTPRMPNQPGGFSQAQMGHSQQPTGQMMGAGGQNQMMPNQNHGGQMLMNQVPQVGGANFVGANPMQQQQQQQSAMNAFNQPVASFAGQQHQHGQPPGGMMDANIQQQQPLGHNSFAPMGGVSGGGGGGSNNLMGINNQQAAAFNNPGGGGVGGGGAGGMQQAGVGNFNNRQTAGMPMMGGVGGMNQMGGEEPGLLNTVKNIFKL